MFKNIRNNSSYKKCTLKIKNVLKFEKTFCDILFKRYFDPDIHISLIKDN